MAIHRPVDRRRPSDARAGAASRFQDVERRTGRVVSIGHGNRQVVVGPPGVSTIASEKQSRHVDRVHARVIDSRRPRAGDHARIDQPRRQSAMSRQSRGEIAGACRLTVGRHTPDVSHTSTLRRHTAIRTGGEMYFDAVGHARDAGDSRLGQRPPVRRQHARSEMPRKREPRPVGGNHDVRWQPHRFRGPTATDDDTTDRSGGAIDKWGAHVPAALDARAGPRRDVGEPRLHVPAGGRHRRVTFVNRNAPQRCVRQTEAPAVEPLACCCGDREANAFQGGHGGRGEQHDAAPVTRRGLRGHHERAHTSVRQHQGRDRRRWSRARDDDVDHGSAGRRRAGAQRNTVVWWEGISNRRRHFAQDTMSSTRYM